MRKLERNLSLFSVVAISIGAMLGGEIFVLPAVASEMTGPSLWLAYLVAASLVLPAALSKSELATAMPDSGGAYLYIERAMGPLAGTVAGVGLWLSLLLKSTFALAILGSYLALLVEVSPTIVGLGLLAFVLVLNIVGVRKVGAIQKVIVAGCLIVLFTILIAGAIRIPSHEATTDWMAHGVGGFAATVGLVFISYAGVTKIAAIAEEVKDAERNIPRGIILSLGLVAVLYTGIALVLTHAFDPSTLGGDETPIASLARLAVGEWGVPVVAVTAVFALLGMTNAGLLASSRFPFAMARGKLAPDPLAQISPRFVTPIAAIVLSGVTMAVFLVTLDVVKIAKLASAFMIAAFMAVNVSVIVFRESKTRWYKPAFRAPLYPFLQIFGVLAGAAILISLGTFPLLGVAIGSAAGSALYFGYGRRRVSRLGVLRQMGGRTDLLDESRTRMTRGAGAQATVALFGTEGSSEALANLGMTLAPDAPMQVLHLEEVPEQTDLAALAEGMDDRIASIERRLVHLGEERNVDVNFDVVYTRDARGTLFDHAAHEHARWTVMAWRDSAERGLIVRNPMQWLTTHLPTNVALFKDAGIRTIRRILAHAVPGPHDALIARTADRFAKQHGAEVTFIRVLPEGADEETLADAKEYHHQLGRLCELPTHSEIVKEADDVAALVHASARFDLLITGTTTDQALRSMFVAAPEERVTEAAHCAVLQLRAPQRSIHGEMIEEAPDPANAVPEPVAARTKVDIRGKDQLFGEIARVFDLASPRIVADTLEPLLWERERTQNTAVGHGVAIPHAVVPGLLYTKFIVLVLDQPVPYDETGTEVDVVLALVGPPSEREAHLRLLAQLARMLLTTQLLDDLRSADGEAAVLAAFADAARESEA